ncbi:MAG: DNA polymerase I [bacterium]
MKKRLIIIDGHALLHRAWHALPPLTTKDGLVVSGAYGFIMILLKAIKELKPTHLAVTFDLAGPTFRHEEYEAYKATREERPDELYEQVPIIEEVLGEMGIPFYTAKGFEADDVIGTIATMVRRDSRSAEVIIVTGDKDTLQLVEPGVSVYTLRKGMTDTVIYDPAGVEEKMGVRPDQMVDYKALRGDPSDNIPGVRGIGDKTAVDLLKRFDSLEGLYGALDSGQAELSPAMRKKLLDGRADAFQSQHLCRIKTDVKIDFSLEDTAYHPVTREAVRDTFERYQFNRLLNQLPKADSDEGRQAAGQLGFLASDSDSEGPEAEIAESRWLEISTAAELERHVSDLKEAKVLAFRSVGVQPDDSHSDPNLLAISDGREVFIISGKCLNEPGDRLKSLLSGRDCRLVCHDLKGELYRLTGLGLEFGGSPFDLMLASYLLHAGERRHSLDSMLSFHRNVPPPEKGELDDEGQRRRLAVELMNFIPLADSLTEQLKENGLDELFRDMEVPLAYVLARMERNGIRLDSDRLVSLSTELERKISDLRKKIVSLAGEDFNINSPVQLKEVLFDRLGLSPVGLKKTERGQTLSTAAAELEKIRDQHEIVDAILDYRELTKLKSTYVDALPPLVDRLTGRIHANFNQTVTATGRLSSSDPNMQNIPTAGSDYGRMVREAFVAPPGSVLLAADYSQIELRIAAHIADEPAMIEAFRSGEDIHYRTAVEMFGEDRAKESRRIAKAINFGILYGMGAQRLAATTDLSASEARSYIDQYFALHSGIERYISETKQKLVTDGFVETLFGRKRFFPNFHLLNQRERAEAERQAINMPVQGTSADMIKQAMISIDRILSEKYGRNTDAQVRMVIQVHDELVFEVKEDLTEEIIEIVSREMTSVVELKVPVAVDIKVGPDWGSMEGIK